MKIMIQHKALLEEGQVLVVVVVVDGEVAGIITGEIGL
jgi:CBS domain-containing protein